MFTVFNKILKKETLLEEDYSKINPFILNRWLSGSNSTLHISNVLNQYDNIPLKEKITLLKEILPNIKYIPYGKKENTDDKYILMLSKNLGVNLNVAKMYYENLTVDDLEQMEQEYTHGGVKR